MQLAAHFSVLNLHMVYCLNFHLQEIDCYYTNRHPSPIHYSVSAVTSLKIW